MVLIFPFCLEWVNLSVVDIVAHCGVYFMYFGILF